MFFIPMLSSAQSNKLRVWIKSEDAKPAILQNAYNYTNNDKLNKIFKNHNVYSYIQEAPFAKNPELLKIYVIKFNDDADSMKKDLQNNANELFSCVVTPAPIKYCYNPSDYMWTLTLPDTTGWLWHLYKTQAYKAWDITHGDSSVYIAVEDSYFDPNHPDLMNQIKNPLYNGQHYSDPYTVYQNNLNSSYPIVTFKTDPTQNNHGTTTASFAGAQTNGGGQLASIGFNTKLYALYSEEGTVGAAYAADVLHADVISISWFYSLCYDAYSGIPQLRAADSLYVQEILNAGTILVVAAGNGYEGNMSDACYVTNNNQTSFIPIPPFSCYFDNRIITVSSTDTLDYHQFFVNGTEVTHSFFPQVDICSPGYVVLGATCTKNSDGTNNSWPYYGSYRGTSFATPIVAGVCALMKSVDPYLGPVKAKSIIKSTADPIKDASKYPGMVGAGRINAYKCVMLAGTKSFTNTNLTGTNTYKAGYSATLNNVTIQNSANININARSVINLGAGFNVQIGSTFNATTSPTTVNSNNW